MRILLQSVFIVSTLKTALAWKRWRRKKLKPVNEKWIRMHTKLLSLMRQLELSKSTRLRIILTINKVVDQTEVAMRITEEAINILQQCKTEQEVLEKLDEKGW